MRVAILLRRVLAHRKSVSPLASRPSSPAARKQNRNAAIEARRVNMFDAEALLEDGAVAGAFQMHVPWGQRVDWASFEFREASAQWTGWTSSRRSPRQVGRYAGLRRAFRWPFAGLLIMAEGAPGSRFACSLKTACMRREW